MARRKSGGRRSSSEPAVTISERFREQELRALERLSLEDDRRVERLLSGPVLRSIGSLDRPGEQGTGAARPRQSNDYDAAMRLRRRLNRAGVRQKVLLAKQINEKYSARNILRTIANPLECVRRGIRKEVLHALGFTGKGRTGKGPYRRTNKSSIKC